MTGVEWCGNVYDGVRRVLRMRTWTLVFTLTRMLMLLKMVMFFDVDTYGNDNDKHNKDDYAEYYDDVDVGV